MKKIFLPIIVALICLVISTPVFAHPSDISNTFIYINKNSSGNDIDPNKFEGQIIFNWGQLSNLADSSKDPVKIFDEIEKYDEILNEYIDNNFSFTNNFNKCTTNIQRVSEQDITKVLNNGISYTLKGECSEDIRNITVENSSFEETTVTQSNSIQVYFDNNKIGEDREGKVSIYEVSKAKVLQNSNNQENRLITFFNSLLEKENIWAIPMVLLTIYIMGVLHSFEGGHNKLILGSLVIDQKINLKQSVLFTCVFTLTHMSDIILLSVGILILDQYIDLYRVVPDITLFTLITLLVVSGFTLIKEIKHFISHKFNIDHEHHHDHSHEHEQSHNKVNGNTLLLAFISGLAPCVTGWTIFMLLFSTGNTYLILPGMLFFGLGVFSVLMIYTYLLYKTKSIILDNFAWVSKYSTLISMTLVMISAVIQLILILN